MADYASPEYGPQAHIKEAGDPALFGAASAPRPERPAISEPKPHQLKRAIILRALGRSTVEIAHQLGLAWPPVRAALAREENQALVEAIRDATKTELIATALQLQQRYFEGMQTMPVDRDHAVAHKAYADAIAKLYEKGTHAAGEATERIEQKIVALSLDEKRAYAEQLRAARALKEDREREAIERTQSA